MPTGEESLDQIARKFLNIPFINCADKRPPENDYLARMFVQMALDAAYESGRLSALNGKNGECK
jgi:hypothetical protein